MTGSPNESEAAEQRFLEALERQGARDPRDFYRGMMKDLRETNPAGYEEAVSFYKNTLIPGVASGAEDPLRAWMEYGRRIAQATAPGQTVEIDVQGRRHPYSPPTPADRLVLHLPDASHRAFLVGLPPTLSAAQRATFDLLVQGKLKLHTA